MRTYGDHVQLGDAILFDRQRQRNSIFLDQHCALIRFVGQIELKTLCADSMELRQTRNSSISINQTDEKNDAFQCY